MANRKGRRLFGSIRKRPSGRWTARVPVTGSGGTTRSLGTFPTKRAAEDALAIERGAIVTGTWIDPDRGTESVGDYAATFIATNGYRERSRALNERLLAQWIATTQLVTIGDRRHAVALGDRPLASITAQDVRLWHAAVAAESRRRAAARHQRAATSPQAVNAAIRAWAAEAGIAVGATGRIPAAVRAQWEASGGRTEFVKVVEAGVCLGG